MIDASTLVTLIMMLLEFLASIVFCPVYSDLNIRKGLVCWESENDHLLSRRCGCALYSYRESLTKPFFSPVPLSLFLSGDSHPQLG